MRVIFKAILFVLVFPSILFAATPVTLRDGDGELIGSTANALDVNIASGTVTATPSGTQDTNITQVGGNAVTTTVPVSASSLPLPTGAATLAEQQTQSSLLGVVEDWDESDRAKVNPIEGGVGVQGDSGTVTAITQRVVLATDVALPAGTNSIGEVTANAGTGPFPVSDNSDSLTVDAPVDAPVFVSLSDGASPIATLPVSLASVPLPTGASTLAEQQTQTTALQIIDDWDESDRAKVNPIVGQAGVAAGVGTSSATTQRFIPATGATGTLSNVAGSASSGTILASNTSRISFHIFNDSSATLYLKFNSGAASTSSFTVMLQPYAYYEDKAPCYNGAITGIWSSATGNARVTEVT